MNLMSRILTTLPLIALLASPNTPLAEDQTILLDESLIVGTQLGEAGAGQKKRVAGPALSTALRWEGEAAEAFDIPKEILDHLTQSDLSFFINREADRDGLELLEDDGALK